MGPIEFTDKQLGFIEFDGVSFLGGCCGTTPQHINALSRALEGKSPKLPTGELNHLWHLWFNSVELFQELPHSNWGEE